MRDNISFKMSDGLVINGTLMGNIEGPNLVVMLHSGGYDRLEWGVKEVLETEHGREKVHFNSKGNYEYLSSYLQDDAAILLIDQRNHGRSGKNIDEDKMIAAIKEIANISNREIELLNRYLKERNNDMLEYLVTNLDISDDDKDKLWKLLKKPIIKDMSFIQMANDLEEVLYLIRREYNYSNIHLVGTCMGALVSGLYTIKRPEDIKSLTLFSPLYTFDPVFLNPQNDFNKRKREIIDSKKQYRMGNAVEGLSTIKEIEEIRRTFYEKLFQTNIPIFCIQGVEDKLVPVSYQSVIFETMKKYRNKHNLAPVYYAEIEPGVHCLYDVIFPSLMEAINFIEGNLEYPILNKKPSL